MTNRVSISELRSHCTIVPIGNDCSIAHFLTWKKLRNSAYPFDWTVTPFPSALELLQTSFSDFLSDKNLYFGQPANRMYFDDTSGNVQISNELITPVIDRKHAILFPHDFRTDSAEEILEVRAKYTRRISRLMEILASPEPKQIAFIACDNPINDWQASVYADAGINFDNSEFGDWQSATLKVARERWPQHQYAAFDFNREIKPGTSLFRALSGRLRDIIYRNE